MKILFIYYETPDEPDSFPIGVGLLSAILKKNGHQVKGLYVHSNLDNLGELEKIFTEVKKSSPQLICYSSTSPAFRHIRRIAQYLRKNLQIPAICGGVHPTLYPEDVLSVEGIDYICVGDGEDVIIEFIEKLELGQDCSAVPGIWTLNHDKNIVRNRLYPLNKILDSLPWIDYEAFGKPFIRKVTKDGWLRYISSRGCPYNCSYCHVRLIREAYSDGIGVPMNKVGYVRFKSVDSCIEEIKHLVQKYDLKVINFMDDLFCLYRNRTVEFCKAFKREMPSHVGFSIQTHLNHLDEDLINILRDSRCLRVVVGVESASQRILDLFNRKTGCKKISENLSLLVRANFPLGTWTLNILGSPTETKEEMMETLIINAKNAVDRVKFNIMVPYPGSEIYKFCKDNDLFDRNSSEQEFRDRYSSKLKFPAREKAFLEKLFDIGHWYMNLYLPSGVGAYYEPLVQEIEKIGLGEWELVKPKYRKIDKVLSKKLLLKNKQHYNFIYQGKVIGKVIGLQIKNSKTYKVWGNC